jgi:3-deoxy-D-manno-octulosonate 8-phosphate phosphatase (KDO 8-P phosphatase)
MEVTHHFETTRMTLSLTQRAAQIELLLLDVDGVLTDGKMYFVPGPDGAIVETKGFDSQDGIALHWLARLGLPAGVISGRDSPATTERARQLNFRYVYQGHTEKVPIFEEILGKAKLEPSQVAFVGDDFTDLVLLRRVGLGVATANARPEVKREAHYVTTAPGGQGAIRETVELILKAKGRWGEILAHYGIAEA